MSYNTGPGECIKILSGGIIYRREFEELKRRKPEGRGCNYNHTDILVFFISPLLSSLLADMTCLHVISTPEKRP